MSGFAETYFGRITDRGQAVNAMRAAAQGAALLAAIYALDPLRFLHAITGEVFVLDVALVLDAVLLLFVAFAAVRHRSRAFAVLMAGWVVLFTVGTILFRIEHMAFGNNIFLAAVGLYFAFRMVLATRRYHRLVGTRLHGGVAVLKNVTGCAAVVLAVVGLHAVLARVPDITVEPRILNSLTLLVATLAYAVPFARWFPVLGRRPLTRTES
ncbi:MAG: hypothetical protein WD673_04070 [Alphaproteobacteria bacterium]